MRTQANQITSLDAAMKVLFHISHPGPAAPRHERYATRSPRIYGNQKKRLTAIQQRTGRLVYRRSAH